MHNVSKCWMWSARREVASGMKRLAGSNESWSAGGKCRDSCRSEELEAKCKTFLLFSNVTMFLCVLKETFCFLHVKHKTLLNDMSFYLLFPHSLPSASRQQNLPLHHLHLFRLSSELHQRVPPATGRRPILKQQITRALKVRTYHLSDSELNLLEFCQLLKMHLFNVFSWEPQHLVTVVVFGVCYKCTHWLTY